LIVSVLIDLKEAYLFLHTTIRIQIGHRAATYFRHEINAIAFTKVWWSNKWEMI